MKTASHLYYRLPVPDFIEINPGLSEMKHTTVLSFYVFRAYGE
jgi:hypothetical protein